MICSAEMECSIGKEKSETCSKEAVFRNHHHYPSRLWNLFKLRSGVGELYSICNKHTKKFGELYASKQKICCNPLNIHTNLRFSRLWTITSKFHDDSHRYVQQVIEGRKLCIQCKLAVNMKVAEASSNPSMPFDEPLNLKEDGQDEINVKVTAAEPADEGSDGNESDPDTLDANFYKLNKTLEMLEQSPVSRRRMSRLKKFPIEKYANAAKALNRSFDSVLKKTCRPNNEDKQIKFEIAGQEMIHQLKEKFVTVTKTCDKIRILSVLPSSWSVHQVQDVFGCSEWLVRKTKNYVKENGILYSPSPKKGRPISEDTIMTIQNFYREPDSSKELPGKKDCKSVKEGDKRVTKQKRLVLCNLSELFECFKQRFPDLKIGFSMFAELRPEECVLSGAPGTHTVCLCMIHQNFKLQFQGAGLDQIKIDGESVLPSYRDCLKLHLCNIPTDLCYLGDCREESCGDLGKLKNLLWSYIDSSLIEEFKFKQWAQQERCSLMMVVKDSVTFVESFIEYVPILRKHDFIAAKQTEYFKSTRDSLREGEVLVVADFSENYAFVFQDSVQSVHYNNTQATVHPFAAYYLEDGNITPLNFVVISDCMDHNTSTVYAFQTKFIDFMKTKIAGLRKIYYFSDGAGSQYKNRFNMINLIHHEADFGVPAEWHFFATAHGKGPSDGLGGTLKRIATRASLQGTCIQTPWELYEWATKNCNLNVTFVSSNECSEAQNALKERFSRAAAVPGIRSFHSAIPSDGNRLKMKVTSGSENFKLFNVAAMKRQNKTKEKSEAYSGKKKRKL